jgi:hypothetical protein
LRLLFAPLRLCGRFFYPAGYKPEIQPEQLFMREMLSGPKLFLAIKLMEDYPLRALPKNAFSQTEV